MGGRCQQVWQHRLFALDSIVWRLLIIREAVLLLLFLWSLVFAEAESEAEAISEQATQAKRVVAVVVVVVVVAVMAMAVLDVNCGEERESRTRVTAQYCAAAAPSSSLLPNDETE